MAVLGQAPGAGLLARRAASPSGGAGSGPEENMGRGVGAAGLRGR